MQFFAIFFNFGDKFVTCCGHAYNLFSFFLNFPSQENIFHTLTMILANVGVKLGALQKSKILKKNVFFQNFKTFCAHKKSINCFFYFFRKKFPKEKTNTFFQKTKVLVYRSKQIFFSEKKFFLQKIKCLILMLS
jgi:hypothetical protein